MTRWVILGLFVLGLGAGIGPGVANGAVAVDALGALGDEHIIFPHYSSPDRANPSATVGSVGDVDADGLEDTAIVLDSFEESYPSRVWVNFSEPGLPSTRAAGQPGWRGFQVVGDHFWSAVAGLGDVNGDGLGEIVVQGYTGTNVVFGRRDGQAVDVSELGSDGFRIINVNHGTGRGFGHVSWGSAYTNSTIRAVGDQSGDGRPDLAMRDGRSVKVIYSPLNPAGATVDADNLGAGGYELIAGDLDVFVDRLGDLNGDGRMDLAAMWDGGGAGVLAPGPGAKVDLSKVAEAGTGFELELPDARLENGITLGDQNGDGVRELAFVVVGWERQRTLVVANSPPLGSERTVTEPLGAAGFSDAIYDGNVNDVGDQDGDGRSDVSFSDVVRFSGDGSFNRGVSLGVDLTGIGGSIFISSGMLVGSVADRNADGRRELIAVHAAPYHDDPPYESTWLMDIFVSAPQPVSETIEPPVIGGEGTIGFAGTFLTSPTGDTRSLGARALVALTDERGRSFSVAAPESISANRVRTRAEVKVAANSPGLVHGASYRYQLLLENGRGLVGASPEKSFVYSGPSSSSPTWSTPPPAGSRGAARPGPRPGGKVSVLTGTSRRDRLVGGRGRDLIRGLAGNDLIRGLAGADRLHGAGGNDRVFGGTGADRLTGGKGRDYLDAGPGTDYIDSRDGTRDRVRCGTGSDRVRADARDSLRGCERVRRSR